MNFHKVVSLAHFLRWMHKTNRLCPVFQCLTAMASHDLLSKCTAHLLDQQALRIVFNTLEGNYALCLLANLIHLAYLQEPDKLVSVLCPDLSVSYNWSLR